MTTAINIPTGLSPNANGSYTHLATGFVVHDVWSIKDLLDANGAFAYSVVTGEWRWVAGTDLTAFIKAFGSATLGSLAAAMLAPQVMTIHGWTAGAVRGVGGSSQGMICPGAISWPGLTEPAQGAMDVKLVTTEVGNAHLPGWVCRYGQRLHLRGQPYRYDHEWWCGVGRREYSPGSWCSHRPDEGLGRLLSRTQNEHGALH